MSTFFNGRKGKGEHIENITILGGHCMENIKDFVSDENLKLQMDLTHKYLGVRGTIEHSFRHAEAVAQKSKQILIELNYSEKEAYLAEVAGYLHDIGNMVNRYDHGRSGALISYHFLKDKNFPDTDIATILGAIGNHEESTGHAVSSIAAAVIIADKSDVNRNRVRKKDPSQFTPRDRVNYAVNDSWLEIDKHNRTITLHIKIDTNKSSVMEYFEIFLTKMMMCKRAAEFLDANFKLSINETSLL